MKSKPFLETHPHLLSEWHPTKNKDIDPNNFSKGSEVKVWWLCTKGHDWSSDIGTRTRGRGCPKCAGNVLIRGESDLATKSPDLAKEWHPTKNGELKPSDVFDRSGKKAWWQCSLHSNHEWEAVIGNRTGNSHGCPICAGVQLLEGFNDLASQSPDLAKEWHPTKNGELKPSEVGVGTTKKVWWQCSVDSKHVWEAVVISRSQQGTGCPICSGRTVLSGYNDLLFEDPEIAKEWHPTKNGDLKPSEVSTGSNRKVWWQCQEFVNHAYEAAISSRTGGQKSGCPICAGKIVLKGFNDLESREPDLAKEWHPTKNGELKPSEVGVGTTKKVWWQCPKFENHEWNANVVNRTNMRAGCPICGGNVVLAGFNDLASQAPDIAREWHPTKNGDLTTSEVNVYSNQKRWWLCEIEPNHEWKTAVGDRTRVGRGCPSCAKSGFDPNEDGYFYFLRHELWGLLQIGITNKPKRRLATHHGLGWTDIEVLGPLDGHFTRELELDIMHALDRRGIKRGPTHVAGKFTGFTESWFEDDFPAESIRELRQLLIQDDEAKK
jgi:hypothetical protein